jgi:hypothetical protein
MNYEKGQGRNTFHREDAKKREGIFNSISFFALLSVFAVEIPSGFFS